MAPRGRQGAPGHVADRGEVPGVGRVVDGKSAAGDSVVSDLGCALLWINAFVVLCGRSLGSPTAFSFW